MLLIGVRVTPPPIASNTLNIDTNFVIFCQLVLFLFYVHIIFNLFTSCLPFPFVFFITTVWEFFSTNQRPE